MCREHFLRWVPYSRLILLAGALACASPKADAGAQPPGFVYGPFFVDSVPALVRGPAGSWDDGLVDPGGVTFHHGRFHALYNAIREWPSPLSVGYASSPDGRAWRRESPEPVFTLADLPYPAWSLRANSVIVEDGEWVLYFSVASREGWLIGEVGRATATGPLGPWTADPVLVLVPGNTGWDAAGVGDAKVIPTVDGYAMYFTGVSESGERSVGRAISTDGMAWLKDPGPVLRPGVGGGWDAAGVSDPSVGRAPDGGWIMAFQGSSPTGSVLGWATSADGMRWSKSAAPLVTPTSLPAFDVIFYNALIVTQSWHAVLFEAGAGEIGTTQVYRISRVIGRTP